MTWVAQVERKARMIHQQIAAWHTQATQLGVDPEIACARFYKLLDVIYAEDLPLAKAKDASDLLLRIEGKGVENAPRISILSGLFSNVKGQVRDLTKAISGISPDRRVSAHDIDLSVSGIAKGSLYVGLAVPLPTDRNDNRNLLGTEDPLYRATKDALKAINTVSHNIELTNEEDATRHLAEIMADPKVRDAALVAVRRIAPTGKQGVDRIEVSSADEVGTRPGQLTPSLRQQIGKMLRKPVVGSEIATFEGVVREIDLDARRFELRQVANARLQDIRCVYNELPARHPRELLDVRVRVRGRVERRADQAPRLLEIDSIDVL
jgi:hypothetical protein